MNCSIVRLSKWAGLACAIAFPAAVHASSYYCWWAYQWACLNGICGYQYVYVCM